MWGSDGDEGIDAACLKFLQELRQLGDVSAGGARLVSEFLANRVAALRQRTHQGFDIRDFDPQRRSGPECAEAIGPPRWAMALGEMSAAPPRIEIKSRRFMRSPSFNDLVGAN